MVMQYPCYPLPGSGAQTPFISSAMNRKRLNHEAYTRKPRASAPDGVPSRTVIIQSLHQRIVCTFGRVRELLKSPYGQGPDTGPKNVSKKAGPHDGKAMWSPDDHSAPSHTCGHRMRRRAGDEIGRNKMT